MVFQKKKFVFQKLLTIDTLIHKNKAAQLKRHLLGLSVLLLICLGTPVVGQQYLFNAQLLTTEDGLANLMTTTIHQDKQGFMWISTPYGLNNYDGYSFRLYTKEEHNLFSNDDIRMIKEDQENNLWLFYLKQLPQNHVFLGIAIDVFDRKTEKAVPLEKYIKGNLPFDITEVNYSFVIDPKKRLWLTTRKGQLFLYNKGVFQKVYEQAATIFEFVTIDEQDNIWLGYDKEVICINQSGELLEQIKLPHHTNGIWYGEDQTLWLTCIQREVESTELFVWKRKKGSQQLEPFTFSDRQGLLEIKQRRGRAHIYQNRHGFWNINLKSQNFLFDKDGIQLINFNALTNVKSIGPIFSGYFEGEDYQWWLSPKGVMKIGLKKNPFQLIQQIKGNLSDCRGITEDEFGNIHFLNKSLYSWHPTSNSYSQIGLKPHDGYALSYKDSLLFVGTHIADRLGYKVDLRTKTETILALLSGTNFFCTLPSKTKNKLLIGTNKGLEYIDIENDKALPFEKYKNGNPTDELLKKSIVYHLHNNTSGIWAATDNGIFLLDENQGIFKHFDISNSLPFNHIMHIHEDEEGVFWLATKGGGVLKWQYSKDEKNKPIVQQFTTKNGLSNNYLYAIYEDDYDRLWIPSDRGIMCMDRKTNQVLKTYLVEDGLPHNEFNTSSHYQAKDGTLYFGGLGGLISFHPKVFAKEAANKTPMAFTRFSVLESNTEEITDKTNLLKQSSAIEIQPDDKFIELQFALLDFDSPEKHQYAYRIEGYSDKWQYINENNLRITTLPYGEYVLKVKGQNLSQGWSKQELSLKIHVLKPFYLQWWFIALLLLIAVSVVIGFIKWREQSLEKEKERLETEVQKRTQTIQEQAAELKQLDIAKTRFFSNITHEFRTPLTLIIGPLEQLLDEKANLPIHQRLFGIFKNAHHLLTLINQILDISKLEGGKMRIEVAHGNIVKYTNELILRFQPLAAKKQQELNFICILNHWETHFDKNKWNKIIYNLVANAIKFTPKGGAIEVQLSKIGIAKNEAIRLVVKDTGIGIEKTALNQIFDRFYQADGSSTRMQEGTGIGLSLAKELVELQGGTISVKSEIGVGTSFEIELPLLKEQSTLQESNFLEEEPLLTILEEPSLVPVQTEAVVAQKPSLDIEKDKLTLLLIEDNDEMRAYIRQCLDESKYQILEACDGEEGIDKALTHVPDLIISDVMMPKKNGFDVVRTIRANLMTSHIPLILLTAKASLDSRLKGFKRGTDAYLTKPFSPQELALRIQKLIEIRRLLQARYRDNKGLEPDAKGQFEQEDAFIIELKSFIVDNLSDSDFNSKKIEKQFAFSRTGLYHKLKALTGQSISEYIRSIRLERAYSLIKEGKLNLTEIAYETGFSSLSHFSRTFKKAYQKSPSELQTKI